MDLEEVGMRNSGFLCWGEKRLVTSDGEDRQRLLVVLCTGPSTTWCCDGASHQHQGQGVLAVN